MGGDAPNCLRFGCIDALEAKDLYEERREGLGLEFECGIDSAVLSIQEYPTGFPEVIRTVRRCLVGTFPFAIFYRVEKDGGVLVLAIFHVARDPQDWKNRI